MNTEQKLSRDLIKIENRIQEVLQPITPPAIFVEDLRERLNVEMVKKQKSKKVTSGLLIAGGVLGLAALLITVIRTLTSWEKMAAAISKYLPKMRKREQAVSV
jgi:predicted PurR-regulated permease PerM